MSLTRQSVFLAVTLAVIFSWQLLSLDGLTVPFLGLLILAYLILSRLMRKKSGEARSSSAGQRGEKGQIDELGVLLLVAITLLLIFSTGGIDSLIFFLLYFISFAITFSLKPETVFIFLAGIVMLFLPTALSQNVTENIIKLGSVVLITPLAYFFGKEYRVVEHHQQKDAEIASRISHEAADILQDQTLPEKNKAELAEIIEEAQKLNE